MLTNANVQMGNLHLSRRNVDFSKFIFPMYIHADHSIRDYSRRKKETSIYNSERRMGKGGDGGRGRGRSRSTSRDGKCACHLIDCAGPRSRARQLWSRPLSISPSFCLPTNYEVRRAAHRVVATRRNRFARITDITGATGDIRGRATLNYRARSKLNIVVTTTWLRHDVTEQRGWILLTFSARRTALFLRLLPIREVGRDYSAFIIFSCRLK